MRARSLPDRYAATFSNGDYSAPADTTAEKGGGDAGFRPHDLLEAALATCLTMTLRMAADERGFPLETVSANVTLDRSAKDEVVFEYSIELQGELTDAQREELLEAAGGSSVRQTLS